MTATAALHAKMLAQQSISQLGLFPGDVLRQARAADRAEVLLWKFFNVRCHDIHHFFENVEPIEAVELVKSGYAPGKIYQFLSERYPAEEWSDVMVTALSLLLAAHRQAEKRGFDPQRVGIFTLQRMVEQLSEDLEGLKQLLDFGVHHEGGD